MRDGRTISIKDPKLQKVRNNLRLVILKECSKRKSEISDNKYALTHDKDGNYIGSDEDTDVILKNLSDKWWEIERPLRASIVKCATCSTHKKDMTYHRKSRSWYCVDCHRKNFARS